MQISTCSKSPFSFKPGLPLEMLNCVFCLALKSRSCARTHPSTSIPITPFANRCSADLSTPAESAAFSLCVLYFSNAQRKILFPRSSGEIVSTRHVWAFRVVSKYGAPASSYGLNIEKLPPKAFPLISNKKSNARGRALLIKIGCIGCTFGVQSIQRFYLLNDI